MDDIEVKHFTVEQIRDWLEHNKAVEGLSSEVIRPDFAWALIHHPNVLDNEPMVAAVYDNGILAAATCASPECMAKPLYRDDNGHAKRVWWFPMLWVKPEYRGKGYGLVVIGSLAEIYGMDCAWTVWAVKESIEIFEFLGCKTYYFPHYFMNERHYSATIKGRLADIKQKVVKWWRNRKKPALPHYDYSLRYLNNVDDESYEFICQNSKDNVFLSSQEILNWELQYPWNISMPLSNRVPVDGKYFHDRLPLFQYSFVQVWSQNRLVGVYRFNRHDTGITVDLIYYDKKDAETVYASVVEHIQCLKANHFDTEDVGLAGFVQKYIYFPICKVEKLSLSISPKIQVPENIVR